MRYDIKQQINDYFKEVWFSVWVSGLFISNPYLTNSFSEGHFVSTWEILTATKATAAELFTHLSLNGWGV